MQTLTFICIYLKEDSICYILYTIQFLFGISILDTYKVFHIFYKYIFSKMRVYKALQECFIEINLEHKH